MTWLLEKLFKRRPIVAIEDHVYHISELLRNLQVAFPTFFSDLTVVCLDNAGPDTDAAALEWLETYPGLQVASQICDSDIPDQYPSQLQILSNHLFENQNDYCRVIAKLVRPNGLLLQDIELETLQFVPRDRWWESTMLASTVRGIVGQRPPRCAFISNKRGYEATFGAELLAAGHDPRDVLNKYDMERVVVPFLTDYLEKHFPLRMEWRVGQQGSGPQSGGQNEKCRVSYTADEMRDIDSQLDIILWPERDQFSAIGGQCFAKVKKATVQLQTDSHELETWRQLILAKLQNSKGVEVQSVGIRVAPSGALRAEVTNAAARHIHSLRKRLANPQDIVTVEGCYRLRNELSVGFVRDCSGN